MNDTATIVGTNDGLVGPNPAPNAGPNPEPEIGRNAPPDDAARIADLERRLEEAALKIDQALRGRR
jgi:hypothetical protein